MPVLQNPRHERFARKYLELGIARWAYVEAGYKVRLPSEPGETTAADVGASRLLRSDKIARRLRELRQAVAKRQDVTEDSLLAELEQDRQLAFTARQAGAAVSATVAKAKLVGLMVQRRETGAAGEFDNWTEEQLQEFIRNGGRKQAALEAEALPALTHDSSLSKQ
jgi:hypothetical protein